MTRRTIRLRRMRRAFLLTSAGVLAAWLTAAAFGFLQNAESWQAALFVLGAAAFSCAAEAASG